MPVPEGHTIHRLAGEHVARFRGVGVQVTSPQGRFRDGAALLDGSVLETAEAYGKHLFLGFARDRWLHVHLGLYGAWTFGALPAPPPRGALRLRLAGHGSYADLRGATTCELVTPTEKALLMARLGPDPLRPRPDPEPAWARLSRSRTAVGRLLMDQSVVAGATNDLATARFRRSAGRPGASRGSVQASHRPQTSQARPLAANPPPPALVRAGLAVRWSA